MWPEDPEEKRLIGVAKDCEDMFRELETIIARKANLPSPPLRHHTPQVVTEAHPRATNSSVGMIMHGTICLFPVYLNMNLY
jgi:hypothetical protein